MIKILYDLTQPHRGCFSSLKYVISRTKLIKSNLTNYLDMTLKKDWNFQAEADAYNLGQHSGSSDM